MSDFVKVLRETPLESGGHTSDSGRACVMEKVAILWALSTNQNVSDVFSAMPECTNPVIAQLAQTVNDRLDDENRQRLNPLIPRLLRARRTDSDPRINVRIAIWAARKVLHLAREEDREICETAIDAAQGWLEGTVSDEGLRVASSAADAAANAANAAASAAAYAYAASSAAANAAAYAASSAASSAAYAASSAANAASYAASSAANAAANAAAYAASSAIAAPVLDLVALLDEALDVWEEACSKEGEDIYVPQPWEDEALSYLAVGGS